MPDFSYPKWRLLIRPSLAAFGCPLTTCENTDDLKAEEPVILEIRERMPVNIVSQMDEQARKLHISRAELAKRWIMKGFSQCD